MKAWSGSTLEDPLVRFSGRVASLVKNAVSVSLGLSGGDPSLLSCLWDLRVFPHPPRQGFGLRQHAPDQNFTQGLDLPAWGVMQQRAVLCILGTPGTGEAWPCLATDLKKPIHRTNGFCGCALLLTLVRRDAHASGFCTRLVHHWKHHLNVPPGQYPCLAYLPGTAGALMVPCCARRSWEAPRVLRCVKTAPLNLPFVSLRRIVVLFESSCSKRSLRRRELFPSRPLFFLWLNVYFHCCLGFLCAGWMYWKIIPFI